MNPDRLPAHTLGLVRAAFADWAAEKHGSLENAFEYWEKPFKGDDLDAGKAGILPAWHMTNQGFDAHPRRAADQIEFLTQAQYNLYAEMKEAFREMGMKQMISGSNWKTADPSTLGPLEHYSYSAVDMICRNEYFSPVKITNPRFHAVDVDDVFGPISAMKAPEAAGPLMTNQLTGMPYLITENNWDQPNRYRLEWPFLVATYGRMAGVDGWNFFSYDTPMWNSSIDVWSVATPEIIGQWPAYALMYRRGDVREGEPAVLERKNLQELYNNQPVALPEVQYKDDVWKNTLGGDPTVDFDSKVNPRAFMAGPVRLDLGEHETRLETADLETLLNEAEKIIANTNGQLVWDYGTGIAKVNTPTSQGACGFLAGAGTRGVILDDVAINARNEYASIVAVSLDGAPLAESERILIQAGTPDKPYGFETVPAGEGGQRITSVGGYPLNVERVQATITLRGMAGREVVALDELGYPTDKPVNARDAGDNLVIDFPADTLYLLVR
jgi:hypothetical protein